MTVATWNRAGFVILALLAASVSVFRADAATVRNWRGGVGPNWSEATNWSPGGAPETGDLLTIGSQAQASTMTNNIADLSLQRITFDDRDYVLTGNDLTLGELTVTGGGIAGYNSITLNLKGEARTLVAEDGALRLSGNNTFTGDIDVYGRLSVESNTALGTTAGRTQVLAGGTLVLAGRDLGNELVVLSGGEASLANVSNSLDSVIPNLQLGGRAAISTAGKLNLPNGLKEYFPGMELLLGGAGEFLIGGTSNVTGSLYLVGGASLAWNSAGQVALISGNPLVDQPPTGDLTGSGTAGSVDFRGGTFSPGTGDASGRFTVSGLLKLQVAAFSVTMNNAAVATGFSQATAGSVDIGPGTTLELVQNFNPSTGAQFRIIDNTGDQPVNGTFEGLAEGATFSRAGKTWTITYKGGNGNDVVITRATDAPGDPLPFKRRIVMVARG